MFQGKRASLSRCGESRGCVCVCVFFELHLEDWGHSMIVAGTSGSGGLPQRVKSPFVFQGMQDFSKVTAGEWGLISHLWGSLIVFL